MKTTHAAILLLSVPAILAAQGGGGAPPANPITTVLKNQTFNYQRLMAQAFDSIPESKFTYKPTPAQLTIGYVAQHVAEDNYYFCNNFGAMKATIPDDEKSTPDSVKAKWPKAKLVEQLKAANKFCEEAYAQLDDAKLAEMFEVPGPNGQTRQVPRASAAVGHVADLVDHYSQIANYMRLNNLIPPSALPRPKRTGN
jgi:uncharacterized damage-inducible protein DinB